MMALGHCPGSALGRVLEGTLRAQSPSRHAPSTRSGPPSTGSAWRPAQRQSSAGSSWPSRGEGPRGRELSPTLPSTDLCHLPGLPACPKRAGTLAVACVPFPAQNLVHSGHKIGVYAGNREGQPRDQVFKALHEAEAGEGGWGRRLLRWDPRAGTKVHLWWGQPASPPRAASWRVGWGS